MVKLRIVSEESNPIGAQRNKPMKRIACISTIVGPSGEEDSSTKLMALYNSTRVYNRENDITGVFLVSEKNCLQIMEGSSESLANAVYRISRDDRISDFSIVMNSQTKGDEFAGWTIRFINNASASHHSFLAKLQNQCFSDIQPKSDLDRERLKCFFGHARTANKNPEKTLKKIAAYPGSNSAATETSKHYNENVVSISTWPRPTQLKMTPELIKLCSNLAKRPAHFERILAQNICSSPEKLNSYLSALERLGLLKIHATANGPNLRVIGRPSPESTPESNAAIQPTEKAADRFSSVLRRFLASAKS